MNTIFAGETGIVHYFDNLITAKRNEHDKNYEKLLKKIAEAKIMNNIEKSQQNWEK